MNNDSVFEDNIDELEELNVCSSFTTADGQ